ncbi:hypothetical protein EDB85DRAFT_1889014 [Lactarius pseudohatsudake]|nr:hypothetical protein EDB85DRAFT_1889014 [Lactarius pseudohatsudake]
MPVSLLFGASCYHLLLLRLAPATSYSSDIGLSCRDSNGSEADVSCLSIQSNPAIAIGMIEALMFPPGVQPQEVTVAPATPSDMFQSLGKCVIYTGPASDNTVNTITCGASLQDVKANIFIGQASLIYNEGIIEPVNIAKGTAELTGYACVVDSAQLEGSHRILRIALPTVSGSSTEVPELPLGVEILNRSSTPPARFLRSRATNSTSFFETPALLLTLISIGELIGLVSSDGSVTVIHADLTQSNDILRVSADTLVPTDGIVIRGMTQVDECALTGESLPVDKGPDAPLTAGTRNYESCLGAGGEHQSLKSVHSWHVYRRLGFPSKIWRIALPAGLAAVILVVAIAVFVVWIVVGLRVRSENFNHARSGALRYTIAVLVVSCMCYRTMRADGDRDHWRRRGQRGRYPSHVQCERADGNCDSVLSRWARWRSLRHISLVKMPSRRYFRLSPRARIPLLDPLQNTYTRLTHNVKIYLDQVQPILGKGLEVTTSDGVRIRGGSPSWLGLQADPLYSTMMTKALSMFAVTFDGELVAFFGLTDLPRPSAGTASARGDVRRGRDERHAGAGGGGTDVARDTADIVFLAPDLERALEVLRLSRGAAAGLHQLCVGVRLQLVCCSPRGGRVCTRSDRAGVRGLRRDGERGAGRARRVEHVVSQTLKVALENTRPGRIRMRLCSRSL